MLNNITIMGRLTRDPELRRTQSGTSVTSFTIAVDRDYSGNGQKTADFFNCVAWRNTGEFVAKNFTKGRPILLLGRLETRKWTDKQGNNRVGTEIIAENVYFCDSKPKDTAQNAPQPYVVPVANQYEGFEEISEDDEDLTF